MTKEAKVVPPKSDVPGKICDVFEQGCMYCANKQPTVFNPGNYPQKMHVAEMAYRSAQGTLYVRETTAEVEEQPGDDYVPLPEKKKPPPEEPKVEPEIAILPHNFKGLKQTCSGITFMEEKEERKREAIYNERLKNILAARKLWRAFVKHMEGFKKLNQLKMQPPIWVQELSVNQITQVEKLPQILKQDTDEKSTTNTRRFLNDMGIIPLPQVKIIEKAINDSEMDPLYFLARMQKEVGWLDQKKSAPVKEMSDFQMKKRKYTVSERILLSAIAHLHMPILIFKLHLILPPPAPDKLGKNFNIFDPVPEPGNIPDPKKEWFKPEKIDLTDQEYEAMLGEFQGLNLDDSKATLINEMQDSPSLWTLSSGPSPIRERKSKYFNLEDKTKDLQNSLAGGQQNVSTIKSDEAGKTLMEDDAFLYPSFQSFFQEIETSESTYLLMESFTQTNVSFHDNNVLLRQLSKLKDYDAETEKIEEEITEFSTVAKDEKAEKVEKVATKSASVQTDMHWLPVNATTDIVELFGEQYAHDSMRRGTLDRIPGIEEFGDLEDEIVNLIASIIKRPTEYEIMRKQMLKDCLEKDNIDGLYEIFGLKRPKKVIKKGAESKKKRTKKLIHETKEKQISKKEPTISNPAKKTSGGTDINTEMDKLILKIRKEVEKQPIELQLKFALNILSLAGDPLANFPGLQSHPVLIRWFELRRGINRKLPEKEKMKLMMKSKQIWGSLLSTSRDMQAPKVTKNLTPKELAQFTWDRRLWVKQKAEKVREQFQHELRQALVDDARFLYPTMFTQYYNSKLNKNLREVFFTYLPAKENDYYVFKPWKPEDKKLKKE